ncbi:hypothetical protein TL16_g06358 [Triparma laevis f. inornata]|uniref:EF-hand domain-containing protein n=1 Tax=Triparma laevis f. inornata TaxID=1714386 RepID=A0A9W7EAA0_9STRA|nr:hypothetical protein TL16_g06358 [Triparma laevis f. inornata]
MVEQNKLLREALAVSEKDKQKYGSLYESTRDELQTAREEVKNARKEVRVFEDMCTRYGLREEKEKTRRRTEMANIKKILESKEGEEDETSIVSRLRRQLIQSLDRNRKLVGEIAELHKENDGLSTKLAKQRNPMRKGFLHHKAEMEKLKAEKNRSQANQTTQVDIAELSQSYTASIATGVDTGELMKYIMENGNVESFKTVGSQTEDNKSSSNNNNCNKTSFFNAPSKTLRNKTNVGSATPKTPRTPKTPKGRTILESKVLQMIYDILEKRCISDSTGKAKLDSTPKMTMVAFVADYFSHKYGVAKLAAQQQANFLLSLQTYKEKNSRIRHFLTLLGEIHEEIFCEEISETYMDMIKGIMLYKNYEGVSEKLDDGVGNVKLTKKQAAAAIFGQDAKLQNIATWKSPFLLKVVGSNKLRSFYNENVSQPIAASSEKKPTVDFDEFSEAFVNMLINALQQQIQKLKDIFKDADKNGNGMVDFGEFKKMLQIITQSEENTTTAAQARELFQLVNQSEEDYGEDDDPDGIVSTDALISTLFSQHVFALSVNRHNTRLHGIASAIAVSLRKTSFIRDSMTSKKDSTHIANEEIQNLLKLQQKHRRASLLKSKQQKESEEAEDTIVDEEVEGWDEDMPSTSFRGQVTKTEEKTDEKPQTNNKLTIDVPP